MKAIEASAVSSKAVKVDARPLFFMHAVWFPDRSANSRLGAPGQVSWRKIKGSKEVYESGAKKERRFSVYHDIPEDLKMLIEPIVDECDCELVDIVLNGSANNRSANKSADQGTEGGGSEGLVRIVIDHVNGDGRVPMGSIESVSREVDVQLDAADFMSGRYRLEVTSPGLDRILAREKDFIAATGSEVKLQTKRPIESRKRFKGTLKSFENGTALLEVDNAEVRIPFVEVEKANSIYQFSREDFAGERAGEASK
jgi:ribosome maturation factor RimP